MSFSDTLNLGNKPASSWTNMSVNSVNSNTINAKTINVETLNNVSNQPPGIAAFNNSKKLVSKDLNSQDVAPILINTGIITSVPNGTNGNQLSIRN